MSTRKLLIIAVAIGLPLAGVVYWLWPATHIDFNTQVKPILNKKCITCHGGVKRESNFSLLFRQDALEPAESGKVAIIPGDAQHSEMIRRLTLSDPEERMPYKKDPLTTEEIEVLKQWIDEGAQWGDHWSYTKVTAQEVPKRTWGNNDVDAFIQQKLVEQNLKPSDEAPRENLFRRSSLDLVGVPVPPNVVASSTSYEKLVDSLLASPHFGEKWASMWMDLARYADTKGYERDDSRTIWRYRDWLIKAFNRDMPYNQFLVEQLAGDLLPNPSDDQLIATAFHRNTLTNDEGGTDNEEFRVSAVLDRVNTTWEALMGTTFACVQCHSHPYDPFRNEEYYKFLAFFNNSRDEDTFDDYPLLRHLEKDDSARLATLKNWIATNISTEKAKEVEQLVKTWQPTYNSLTCDKFVNSELMDTKWLVLRNHASSRLAHVDLDGKNSMIYRYQILDAGGTWSIHLDAVDGPIIKSVNLGAKTTDWMLGELTFEKQHGVHDLYFTYSNPRLIKPDYNGLLFDWFYFGESWSKPKEPMQTVFWQLLSKNTPSTPVMVENPKELARVTNVFQRGNWLAKGKVVEADVPHSLNAFPDGAPKNRLGLAQWITDPDNPLVARTIVNRVWEQLFGIGLVETLEDMGTQGIPPTHRELLDHLAYQFTHDFHWSLKKLIREMVLSATYRQRSESSAEAMIKDPQNKFYSHAPRVRLSAEQLRDQALAVSGLLSNKMYGPSVMPYQPDGIWLSPWNGLLWKKSKGEDAHRRAVYTYWKRSAPYPSMTTFDGATHEVCSARRIRTNTPLQALVTLNDSVFIETSAHLASRMLQHSRDKCEQLAFGYLLATGHQITSANQNVLLKLLDRAEQAFGKTPDNSQKKLPPAERAMALVANAILNLDEVITKE